MSIPTMIVTANSVAQLVGDGADVGDEVDLSVLAGMTFDFLCNIPAGTMIPGTTENDVWLVKTVSAIVDSDGVLCRVNPDGTMGAAGVALLASDALNLTRPLQWRCRPGRIMIDGRWVRPKAWWFNAQPNGSTTPLRDLLPVEGTIAMPAVPDPGAGNPGGGEVTPAAVIAALGATSTGLALVRAVNHAAVLDLLDAVTAAQLAAAVQTAVSNLIDGAPGALDSFLELASAIGNNPDFATDVQSQLNALQTGKAAAADLIALADQFDGLTTGLTGKVDQIAGKGLSTEDYTTAEKQKLAGVSTGATANATNAQLRDRSTHTGQQSADTIVDGAANKAFTAAMATKLAGVAAGATANATDVALRDRSTHTGSQPSTTISDFVEAVQDVVGGFLGGVGGITVDYNDEANTITIGGTGGEGGLTVEDVRDAIGVALVGVGNISVLANDALDTITITTTATVNSTDAALRDRSTHTGAQPIDSVTGLQAALNDRPTAQVISDAFASVPTFTAMQQALEGKSDVGHTHTIANVTGLRGELDGLGAGVAAKADKLVGNNVLAANDGAGAPVARGYASAATPSTMAYRTADGRLKAVDGQANDDVTTFGQVAGALNDKAALTHTHTTGQVTGLDTALTNLGNRVTTLENAPGGGGADSRLAGALAYVGDGTQGPFTINHNKSTRVVEVLVFDTTNGQRIYVDWYVAGPQAVRLEPSIVWAQDRYAVFVDARVGWDDVTAPTQPTVTAGATDTSSIAVTATGSADNVGVTRYRWWQNGVQVAETANNAYVFTGLNSATQYTLGCTTLDRAGNESALGTVAASTTAPANVAFANKGAGARSATNVSSINWAHTVAAGASRYMLVAVTVSHLGGNWDNPGAYSVKTATSSLDGALTYLGGVGLGTGGQETGGVLLFGRLNPTVGNHTITVNITSQGNNQAIQGNSLVYTGVGSVGTAVVQAAAGANRALSVGPITSAVGNVTVFLGGFAALQGTLAAGNTSRDTNGGDVGGNGDFYNVFDRVGAATNTGSTSSSNHWCGGVGIDLKKAA